MHPPPTLDVLARLKDSQLDVVAFGRYVVHLVFENGNRLSVSAPFRFDTEAAIQDSVVDEFPLGESTLMRLLGQNVVEVACDPDGSLDLTFGNRDRLIVYANDPMSEAYTLLIDGREYIV
ncbi:MAG TPA: DUF6188 family protein [Chthoniobacteraceae bacterium]|nr:DUF6188 family protein [Chthoniobacteraceae bacterium]